MCWCTLVLSKKYFSFLYIKTNGSEDSAPLICKQKHKSRFGVNRDLYIVVIFIKSY